MPVTEKLDQGPAGRVAAAICRCERRFWTSPTGDIVVLSPIGEIDLLTLPVVRAALDEALAGAPRHLVVDLAATHFCCAHAFGLLAQGARVAARIGTSYAVAGMNRNQDHIATVLWGARGPRRYLSTAAAVIAIHDQRRR